MKISSVNEDKDAVSLLRFVFRLPAAPLFMRFLLTVPLAGLFTEWLLPLLDLGGSEGSLMLQTLFVLTFVLLVQGLGTVKEWILLPLNIILLLFLWSRLFGEVSLLSWLESYVFYVLPGDVSHVHGVWEFSDLSRESRALILLAGWAIMVSAVQVLVLNRGNLWLFGGTTLLYLTVLEEALELPVYGGFIRACCWILAVQGMSWFIRIQTEEAGSLDGYRLKVKKKQTGTLFLRWSLWVVLSAVLTAGLLHAAGQGRAPASGSGLTFEYIADQVKTWSEDRNSGAAHRAKTGLTGYDALSGDLGGPLQPGIELFFTAQSPEPAYWRGESLLYYTGRRWIGHDDDRVPVEKGEETALTTLAAQNKQASSTVVQKITLHQRGFESMPLFSNGTITKVLELQDASGHGVNPGMGAYPDTGTLRLEEHADQVKSYTVESLKQPVAGSGSLSGSSQVDTGGDTVPDTLSDSLDDATYVQLPADLPKRVYDLGEQLTRNTSGRYEQARAVEAYLKSRFPYTLKTRIPPAGQDFVDAFLFKDQQGYCTHFATAMVVLLRTQGIPARYVTGFAPGQLVEGTSDTYRVTQEEAHAWVEVYVPKQGWTAFDPTPGFYAGQAADASEENMIKTNRFHEQLMEFVQMLQSRISSIQSWIVHRIWSILALISFICTPVIFRLWTRKKWGISRPGSREDPTHGDGHFSEREQLLAAAIPVWRRLARRCGAPEAAVTVKKYMQSLQLEDEHVMAELVDFAMQWENAAYGNTPFSRMEKIRFLRQCRMLAKKLA
ncbi:transglutaminase-like domain-containing protein [Paenibacillus lemnae]|uniref:Transglutaminase domain-containing protein n=1 Tax=Paenibacillus lemnae TaxID=1330551 RepID=A0A848MBJ8_PAELE|nr:transglutaminase-like domain-containing protein [Paenibacillus lemnae]NMO98065.1 transglutaminase domain-containing protein [Paenibacillus lemnae]